MNHSLEHKTGLLARILKERQKVAVAFSGGADSAFLLSFAAETLGNGVIAITMATPYMSAREIQDAKDMAKHLGVRHVVVESGIPENILTNPSERCYLCKLQLFALLRAKSAELGFAVLVDGTNSDDAGEFRPGLRALKESGIFSPLREAGLSKEEIRKLSEEKGLPTWNKPANACLLTRIPYNTLINSEILQMVEKGEEILSGNGLPGARLRTSGTTARIELQQNQFGLLQDTDLRTKIVRELKSLGYHYICIDLEGYRTGSYDLTKGQYAT